MELKNFIKGTITAISESVTELNEELSDKIAVSPSNVQWYPETAPKNILMGKKKVEF